MISAAAVANVCGKARLTTRGYYKCLCPAHDDHVPSLKVMDSKDGIRLRCFRGCEKWRIKRALKTRGVKL
jgi:hypothetical protein